MHRRQPIGDWSTGLYRQNNWWRRHSVCLKRQRRAAESQKELASRRTTHRLILLNRKPTTMQSRSWRQLPRYLMRRRACVLSWKSGKHASIQQTDRLAIPCCMQDDLREWLVPAFTVCDFVQGLTILAAFADSCGRITKGNDGQDLNLLGNAEYGIDLLE